MKRILVVDDDPMVTRLVRINLELEDFEVEEAWDGKAAMKIMEESPPELLVLDIMMTPMDGWEILERIRALPALKDLPVVILTVLVQDECIAKGWKLGADGYIAKPFSPVNLADFLKKVLSAAPGEREARRSKEIERLSSINAESC